MFFGSGWGGPVGVTCSPPSLSPFLTLPLPHQGYRKLVQGSLKYIYVPVTQLSKNRKGSLHYVWTSGQTEAL